MRHGSVSLTAHNFAVAFAHGLAEAPGLAVLVVDHDMVVQDANQAARSVLGAGLESGSALSAAVVEDDVGRLRDAGGGGTSAEPILLRSVSDPARPTGALLVSLVRVPMDDGSLLALVGRSATAEIEREARILRARRWEIVGQLTSGIAHDLNNRLSTVTTFSDLMLGDADPDSQDAEDLEEIKRAGLDSATITRKLDLFAGGHAGGATVSALPDVVRGFEKLIRRFVGNAITVETELDDACPPVAAPPIRIEEILIALVANARDAMPEGGTLVLRVAPGAPGDPEGSAVLEVHDTGSEDVIPPLERALQPFFSSKPHGLGSGLGLGTAHGIARELGGDLDLRREDGRTVARAVLPGHARDAAEPDASERGAERPDGDPRRLAVVEPADEARGALERGLAGAGVRVVAAASLDQLGADAFPADAIVLDVPDRAGAGDRLVRAVRKRAGEIPVVLLRRRDSPRVTLPGTPGVVELAKPTGLEDIRGALRFATRVPAREPEAR